MTHETATHSKPFLNEHEAAEFSGLAVTTLRRWRVVGKGPAYYKLSSGKHGRVVYSRADLDRWLAGCRREVPAGDRVTA
jgi:hypothetical protein